MGYPQLPSDKNKFPVPVLKPQSSEDVDGSSASAQSSALVGKVARIAVVSTSESGVRIAVGSDPTAVATSMYLSDQSVIEIKIDVNDKIAVLDGKVNVTVLV